MRFLDLRHRLFVAMGLPLVASCGGGTQQTPPDEIRIHNVAKEHPIGGPCGADQINETVCGATTPDACGATGDSLTSYGQSQIWVTQGTYAAHDPTFARFQLDRAATEGYQQSLTGQGFETSSYCCYSACTALVVARTAQLDVPPDHIVQPVCFPAPEGGTQVPAEANAACPGAVELLGQMRPYDPNSVTDGQCCYSTTYYQEPYYEHHNRGRAARVDGAVVTAPVARATGWSDAPAPDTKLDDVLRARLADAWARSAQMEHASIASFSNLALRLIAVGAPPALIADAHRAALDEIEHARVAFAFATAYGGAAVGPAAFPDAARLSAAGGLEALALETFVDGCIGETVAAVEARVAAGRASDPVIARALATIAEDETRHAELAWGIVAWCARTAPSLVEPLRAALAAARQVGDEGHTADDDLAPHGVVGARELAALRREILRDVVGPCLDRLIS